MEISRQGEIAFRLAGSRSVSYNSANLADRADICLFDRRRRSSKQIINGPGEYEISGVMIATVSISAGERLAHLVELDGATVLFVGGPTGDADTNALTAVGHVDVLVVETHDANIAQRLATTLAPRVVVPFGAKAAELCSLLGVQESHPVGKLSWNGSGKFPKAVLLKVPGRKSRVA